MSGAQFTAGPWVMQRSPHMHDGQYDFAIHATKAKVIAEAFGRDTNGNLLNAEANARLIAAAPDLLAALKEMSAIVAIHSKATGRNFAWAELECAEAAIAKAEGRS